MSDQADNHEVKRLRQMVHALDLERFDLEAEVDRLRTVLAAIVKAHDEGPWTAAFETIEMGRELLATKAGAL